MKRNLGFVAVGLVVLVVVVLLLRRDQGTSTADAPGTTALGDRFSSDSLGVLLLQLPPDRGWTMVRERAIPGAPVISAQNRDGEASFKLFVTHADAVDGLEDVIRRRRDQLAGLFGVPDIEDVAHVLKEDAKERDGFPAVQWQAITEPVDVAGGDPVQVMFMWLATLRQDYAYEGLGMLRIPAGRDNQRRASTDSLLTDIAFMLEMVRFR